MGGWVGTDRRALLGSPQAGLARWASWAQGGALLFLSGLSCPSTCARTGRFVCSSQKCDKSPARFLCSAGSPPAAACRSLSLHAVHSTDCNTPSWTRSPFHVKLPRCGWPLPELARCYRKLYAGTLVICELCSRTVVQIVLTYLVLRSETDKTKRQQARSTLQPCLG